jgi:uncharacterized protein (UPF0305 family)
MVKALLTEAGFELNKTFKETRFLKPPKTSYCIYLDNFTRRGGDSVNLIKEHNYAIELYSYTVDSEAESKIEQALDKYALDYAKSERYWLETESLYQVIYTFDFIEK